MFLVLLLTFITKKTYTDKTHVCFMAERPKFAGSKPLEVSLIESVEISPQHGVMVSGFVTGVIGFGTGLFEPAKQLFDAQSPKYTLSLTHAARALVTPHLNHIPVQIINSGHSPVTLAKGTHVGTFQVDIEVQPGSSAVVAAVSSKCHDQKLPPGVVLDESVPLSEQQYHKVVDLLAEYNDVFSQSSTDLGRTNFAQHKIVIDGSPFKLRPYQVPEAQRSVFKEAVQTMLDQGVIQPSSSPFSSPVVLVKKKDGTYRFCVDFRKLNSITKKDTYPLPRIDDTLDRLAGAKFFSTMDMNAGYWQVPLAPEDQEKTAFVTYEGGLFEFKVLPFGLCNAPATYQRLMELVLAGLTWEYCLVYIDDVIVFSKTFEDHLMHLRQVFERFRSADLKLKGKKCSFFRHEVKYLGHIISDKGVAPDPAKVKAVQDFAVPKNLKMLRSFLGMVQYYARFVPDLATLAHPLYLLTRKNHRFVWSEVCQHAFQSIKDLLVSDKILSLPDFTKPFVLYTDASNIGLGVVLAQIVDGQEKTIAYASHQFISREQNWPTIHQECFAILWGVEHF